jgi:lysophospholipase L1-like esterase
MIRVRSAALLAMMLMLVTASAEAQVRCGPFTQFAVAAPEPRKEPSAVKTFERINQQVKTVPHQVLFLGDSITERWDLPLWDAKKVWDANMPQRGVLNAGVSGDRTEHLRWRLDHGNLDGPPPKGVILLIGTNDLGVGRQPAEAADGIRATLLRLRQRLPATRILLLGLTPRGGSPADQLRIEAAQVNGLIQSCADGNMITYADIGGALLEPNGALLPTIAPDYLHFNAAGYSRIVPQLNPLIDRLIAP